MEGRGREGEGGCALPGEPQRPSAGARILLLGSGCISQHLEAALLHLQPRCDSQAEGGGEEGWFPLDVRRNLAPLTGVNRPPVAR